MTTFNRSTNRRLQKLTQIPSVWEGDRRPMSVSPNHHTNLEVNGECILWVDGSQGFVRSMDVVPPETGPEAIVRTLIQAMERPQTPARPARPQKILVKDREIQFYLRGVLQDLDITIDYSPQLPVIDELFRGFHELLNSQTPDLPPQYAQPLHEQALSLWRLAPWHFLEEQQILSIEINQWDVGTLYASVMGRLGMEYGVLFYRSQDSLRQFRAAVLEHDKSSGLLEEAFLRQDCLFLIFESDQEEDELTTLPLSSIHPTFGAIHPLEGMQSILYEEDAQVVLVALSSLCRFLKEFRPQLQESVFPSLSKRYRISLLPSPINSKLSISVTISTMPDLAAELDDLEKDIPELPLRSLRDDLIPEKSLLSLGFISWDILDSLRQGAEYYQQTGEIPQIGDGLPVIIVQTSRPKGKTIIDNIQTAGGLEAICFNPGATPFDGDRYDLGLLQTCNHELFLFGEFLDDDPTHKEARKKWNQRCKNTQGHCGLIVAKGLTGSSRGNPKLLDMMALFEGRSVSPQDLGLGTLQLMPQL